MELYSGETHHIVPQFLPHTKKKKKWLLELRKDVGIEFHVEIYFRNTNFTSDITISIIFINVCSSKQKPFLKKY